ncbi:hypothetical protein AND_004767 [Anopheles darlingi]|uniref:DUF753 domain-containing protein n=1 Tax=Anopheles darlingi TaxID=43151 RepID=W5JHG6_ANODA|nr:hypothetical protein AND_004767 [Anopheles darlingi]
MVSAMDNGMDERCSFEHNRTASKHMTYDQITYWIRYNCYHSSWGTTGMSLWLYKRVFVVTMIRCSTSLSAGVRTGGRAGGFGDRLVQSTSTASDGRDSMELLEPRLEPREESEIAGVDNRIEIVATIIATNYNGLLKLNDNKHLLRKWLKCDQCDDDGSVRCSDKRKAQAQLCPQFKSGDRCYEMRRSSNRHTVLQRGCQSSLEAVGIECSEETQCRDYTEHDINVVDSRQASDQGRKCLICSTDAVNGKQCDEASAGLEAESCDLAEDECITMVQDNVLHRKCKSALTTEQQQLCTDSGEGVCVSCNEDGCNRHTLLKCIQCKKSIDPLCRDPSLSNELGPKYCSRFHPGAQCFSRILNEDVERGCTSDSGLTESVCEDNKYCLACATNGCNKETEDFLRDVARCLRCSSSKGDDINCEEATGNTEECDQQEDECFTRVDGESIERNCLATLPAEEQRKCLNTEDNTCLACHGHDCNRIRWRKCYTCSKLADPRCVAPESQPTLPVLFCDRYKYEDVCYAKIVDENNLVRGCGSDLAEEEDVCVDDSRCMKCDVNGCNSIAESALLTRSRCLSCLSSVDGEECEEGTLDPVLCEANNGCYTRVDVLQTTCSSTSSRSCLTCSGSSCNGVQWSRCYQCSSFLAAKCELLQSDETHLQFCLNAADHCFEDRDGEENDRFYCHSCVSSIYPNCVWSPHTSTTKDCGPGDRACATVILPDGHTYRGCSQDPECIEAGPSGCLRCDIFSGCNIDRYPTDRLRCNICQTAVSASCATLPYARQFEKACVRFIADDRCVTIYDGYNVSSRDCHSALGEHDRGKCDNAGSVECAECSSWNCNTDRVRIDDRCLQCTSNTTDCSTGMLSPTLCAKPSAGKCFSRVDPDDGLLVRGCWINLSSQQQAECTKDRKNCSMCLGEGCNRQWLPQNTLSCVQCESKDSLLCAQMQRNDSEVRLCRRHVAGDRCYMRSSSRDGTLQRGCVSDLPEELCAPADACVLCTGENCNRDVFPVNRHSCYQCDGMQENRCEAYQEVYNRDRALLCRLHQENDGCYTRLIRGAGRSMGRDA